MDTPQELLASSHPALTAGIYAAAAVYGTAWLLSWLWPGSTRQLVALGAALHLMATVGRGTVIGFLPLTGKMESFSAASLALAIVAALSWQDNRRYAVSMMTLVVATMATALTFPLDMAYPPPLMWTVWYPLHVPLSFFAYALWGAAAAAAVAWTGDREPVWLQRIDKFALQGFGLWSLSMICGGIWGVVAWGAYFMWDPKVIWSVILWFHYGAFIHLRLTPSLRERAWVRPTLAWLGLVWIFVAYVGTSFLFGRSSHAW